MHSAVLAPAWRSHQNSGRGRDRRCLPTVSGRQAAKDPTSLCTCFAGWSNYGSAEEEPEIVNQLLQALADTGRCLFFDTPDELKRYLGVGLVVLSKLALLTRLKQEVRNTGSSGTFCGPMSIQSCFSPNGLVCHA